jgi:hypothetical protein
MLPLPAEYRIVLGTELQSEGAFVGLDSNRLGEGLCFGVHIDFSRFCKGFGFYQFSSKPWDSQNLHSVSEAVETI